jgi:hypothetical protein
MGTVGPLLSGCILNCFRKHTRQTGLVGSSTSISGFSRKGLSSSSLTKIRLEIFDGGKSVVDDDDIDDMSLAFLFPKLLSEEFFESGGFSDPEGCVAKKPKEKIMSLRIHLRSGRKISLHSIALIRPDISSLPKL